MEIAAEAAGHRADERALVEALKRGEEGAFAALVDEHEALMLRVASTYVRSRAVAQEVVQDTWLSVLKGIGAFEGRSSLKTWIFRILENSAKTRGAREGRSVPFSSLSPDDSADPEQLVAGATWSASAAERPLRPDQLVIARETIDRAVRAMGRLPHSQRRVIAMRDLHGCSSDEVCSLLNISGGNQRVQLHRARATVKRELESYFSIRDFPNVTSAGVI
jgi:RNA polymerase sigma-70 factor (ECF subfamily)